MDMQHYSSTHRSQRLTDRCLSHSLCSCKGWLLAEEMGQWPEQGLLSLEQLQLLPLHLWAMGTHSSFPGCLPHQNNTAASRSTLTSWKYFGILTQKALEQIYICKVLMGRQVCQHPLVTLRNDAVEEKHGLSSCFFPAPPVHTHRNIHTPGSSKPQLDRTFATGSKHRLLALLSKLPSKESCREFSSLKTNFQVWWHFWKTPGAVVGQTLPALLGTYMNQGPG